MDSNTRTIMRQDIREIVGEVVREIVGEVVGEIVSDALKLIDARFTRQDKAIAELRADVKRIDKKLDATIAWVGQHEVRLRSLETAST